MIERQQPFETGAAAVRDLGIRSAIYGRALCAVTRASRSGGHRFDLLCRWQLRNKRRLLNRTTSYFAALVPLIYQPLTALTGARVDIMTALVSFERVFEVLDTPHVIKDSEEALDIDNVWAKSNLSPFISRTPTSNAASVSLGGNGSGNELGDEVLRDISLVLASGTMTALVGPSGSGKSTLASLLPRLYDVSAGSIKIDNRDLRFITQESLRSNVGVVTQDPSSVP